MSELRAENDFEVNVKAEQEIELILHHLEYQNGILISLVEKLGLDHQEIAGAISERLHNGEKPAPT